jgi:hypothetical protein
VWPCGWTSHALPATRRHKGKRRGEKLQKKKKNKGRGKSSALQGKDRAEGQRKGRQKTGCLVAVVPGSWAPPPLLRRCTRRRQWGPRVLASASMGRLKWTRQAVGERKNERQAWSAAHLVWSQPRVCLPRLPTPRQAAHLTGKICPPPRCLPSSAPLADSTLNPRACIRHEADFKEYQQRWNGYAHMHDGSVWAGC